MGRVHYLTRDFNMIVNRKKYAFRKGYVYNVPDEVASQHYFQVSEDKERARIPEEPRVIEQQPEPFDQPVIPNPSGGPVIVKSSRVPK